MRQINWIAIRTAYVVKGWSAQQCAEEFGVNVTTVKVRASKEGWTAERNRNTTDGNRAVVEDSRAIVADVAASHVTSTQSLIELGDEIESKLRSALSVLPLNDLRAIRSLTETYLKLAEGKTKAIGTNRDVRGLRLGDSSEKRGDDGKIERVEFVVVDEPIAETA